MAFSFNKISLKAGDVLLKYYRYLLVAILVIILVIGYVALIKPKWDEVSQTGIFDYNQEKKNLEATSQYLESLKKSIQAYNQISQTQIDKINEIIPSSEAMPDLYVIFEKIAKASDLTMDSIDISTGKNIAEILSADTSSVQSGSASGRVSALTSSSSKNIYVLDISLHLAGANSYDGLKKFLANMEKEIRLMDITSLSFDPTVFSQSSGGEGAISINLRTYYYQKSK